ncbi:hypothetical protein GR212_03085 [Rhizobium lusitanum]|uniref:Uncharacterized protein n=1 Tax=Rhizobium lusitanum TaxID=293958 RepID=A0A6L9TYU9_9HYPH|nr:hypothetical protein [Rhizobium lusitanum]NEI68543.1 hypothetical protein [Rhizobium lusitanum]
MPLPELPPPDVEQDATPRPIRARTTAEKKILAHMDGHSFLRENGYETPTWNEQIRPDFYSVALFKMRIAGRSRSQLLFVLVLFLI